MQALWTRAVQGLAGAIKEDQHHYKKKSAHRSERDKFTFIPDIPVNKQIDMFQKRMMSGYWDGNLQFKGYKGTFKIEYWINIEAKLRNVSRLRSVQFVDTQLDKEHLTLLGKWITWMAPNRFELILKQNELDDQDVQDFIFELFKRRLRLTKVSLSQMQLLIISNPGIYKGNLLKKLKEYLSQKYANNLHYYYQVIKDKKCKSLAIVKILRNETDDNVQKAIEKAKEQISQSFFYDLSLDSCFTKENTAAFEYLIKQCYHEDNLEQLMSLDVSNCDLGEQSVFNQLCKLISTAKGLLSLSLRTQPHLKNSSICQALMGDRYDQLRVNVFDISDNQHILEKAFKVLADNIITSSCKQIITDKSLAQHLPVLVKLYYLTEAYNLRVVDLQKEMLESKINQYLAKKIPKLMLKELDLSKIDNYNRHDLVVKWLLSTVYTEFSSVKILVMQNLDIGRMNSYVQASKMFKEQIKFKIANDPIYHNFKPVLREVQLPKQTYRMDVDPSKDFFLECMFTKQGDLFCLKKLSFIECFRQTNREEGFDAAVKLMIEETEKNPQIQWDLQSIHFESTTINMKKENLQFLLCNKNLKLESFTMICDEFSQTSEDIIEMCEKFCLTIPDNSFHSLKQFILRDIENISFDICELLRVFVYNPKMQLEVLELTIVTTKYDENNEAKLKELINNLNPLEKLRLKSLTFGKYTGTGEKEMMKYLVLSKVAQLEMISFQKQETNPYIAEYHQQYTSQLEQNIDCFTRLSNVNVSNIEFENKEKWGQFSNMFIFNSNPTITALQFNEMKITSALIEGLQESIIQISNLFSSDKRFKLLNELSFTNCSFENVDFLSIFLSNALCKIKVLEITGCTQLTKSLASFKQFQEENNLADLNRFGIQSFTLKNTIIEDINLFQWFMEQIIFNEQRQKLSKLILYQCSLKDPEIIVLARIFKRVKQHHQKEGFKRYYCLAELNLSKNSEISTNSWKQLFDTLQNVNMVSDEDKQVGSQDDLDKNSNRDLDSLIVDCSDLILNKELNLFEKMMVHPEIYKFKPPTQLLELSINVEFTKFSQKNKEIVYNRLIQGLIIFPGNQLQKLCFQKLDLDLFMVECQKVKNKLQLYYQNVLGSDIEIVQLKEFKLESLTKQSEESMNQFILMFLCNSKINLKSLTVLGANSKIVQSILEQSKKREQFSLIELNLAEIEENLNSFQIVEFFKSILLGQKLPIQKLYLGKKFTFEKPELASLVFSVEQEFTVIPLNQLKLYVDNENKDQLEAYQTIIQILISKKVKFQELIIMESANCFNIFDKVYQLPIYTNLEFIHIEKLELEQCKLTLDFLGFLDKLRPTLTSFKITNLAANESEIHEYLSVYKQNSLSSNQCKLYVSKIEEKSMFLWTQFILNQEFKLTDLIIRTFQPIEISENPYHLKYLNLNLQLLYNSGNQLPRATCEQISKKLIFNIDSQLEQLALYQCHLKLEAIKGLTSAAQDFRDKIEREGTQGTTILKLKRFCIYYSLYILNDGCDLLQKEIAYFEYINLERLEFPVTNYNSYMAKGLVNCAQNWLAFQKKHNRKYQQFYPIKYLELGRNEFIDEQEAWDGLCDTFIFTDLTPNLDTLNIHFMSMTDPIIEFILQKAKRFLNSKPSTYVLPLKNLNYSLNTALTSNGWSRIFENFFFHPKVELEELNMISTMLDDQKKLQVIIDAIAKKAMTKQNKKLKLHTFLCFNITLKDAIQQYLSPQPQDYQIPTDQPVEVAYNSSNPGIIDGIPEEFGDIQQMIQSVLYNRNSFVMSNKWNYMEDIRFSPYHLSFIESFIRPLNEYYRTQGRTELTLYLGTNILDDLAQLFKYPIVKPGKPYPYNLLFQNDFYLFQKEQNCIISKIDISNIIFPKLEEISQMDIFFMWKNLKSKKTSIDQVIIDYYLNDDLIDHMFAQGYTERDLISLVRIFPPAKIRAQNTISLQAIKAIYSIFWDAHNFTYCSFEYDFDNFLNIGIGYALREVVYNKRITGCVGRRLKRFFYIFFNIFVSDVKRYVLDEQVYKLNAYLSQQKLFFALIAFTNLLFYAVCILAPVFFTRYYEGDTDPEQRSKYCKSGISAYAGYAYYAFAVITLIIEAYLYRQVSLLLSNHTEKLFEIAEDDEDEQAQTHKVVPVNDDQEKQPESILAPIALKRMRSSVKSKMNNFANSNTGVWLVYLMKLILAQLAKLDLFNDVAFILTCYYCDEMILFYLSLAVTAANNAYYFLQYFFLVMTRLRESDKTAKLISTKFINDFFSISIAGRNTALAVLLDQVAPFNVTVIPNNFITRFLIPNQAGKSINNSVKNYLLKFSCEDVPQILIQMYFIVAQAIKQNGNISWSIYLTISISLLSLLMSFLRFMSIRPSNLSQIDFDKLSDEKKKVRPQLMQLHLKNQKILLEDFNKLHCSASVNIFGDSPKNESDHLLQIE